MALGSEKNHQALENANLCYYLQPQRRSYQECRMAAVAERKQRKASAFS